jgi:muramidase (phage lysozyme)
MPRITPEAAGGLNVCAFLDAIAHSELAALLTVPGSDDGYNVLVGCTPAAPAFFASYACHPLPNPPGRKAGAVWSTAAGRYQILSRWWPQYQRSLALPDFGPLSQDRYAIQQIREQRALDDVKAGRFEAAVAKCRNIWASLPGAGYGQHENTLESLRAAYLLAGGTCA